MPKGPTDKKKLLRKGSPSVWMASIIGSLVLTLIVISVLKEQHIGRIEGRLLKEKQWVVKKAHQRIRKDLNQSFKELHQRAKDIAEDEEIVEALQLFTSNAAPASQQELIQRFSQYNVDEQRSVELYTVAPRLVAWNGFSMPLGEAPLTSQFSNSIQYESIEDRGVWNALAAWHPVTYQGQVIGAVRAMSLIEAQMPVENQYLESFSLADSWQRITQLPVRVWLNQEVELAESLSDETGVIHAIKDPAGIPIGSMYIPYPSKEELETRISNQYVDFQNLVLTLLMISLMAGLLYGMPRVVGSGRVLSEKRLWSRVVPYFVLLSLSWWGMRFFMLYLEVPARWQRGKAPLAPLFDPTHFASDLGGGLFRSLGDTFITGIFILLFSIWLFRLVQRFSALWIKKQESQGRSLLGWVRVIAGFIVAILVSLSVVHVLGSIIHRAVLDSTLNYAERSGIIPDRLVFFMFCTLMIIGIASVIIQIAFAWYSVSQARLHIPGPKVANVVAVTLLIVNGLAVWGYVERFSSGYHVPFVIALIVTTSIWAGSFIISRYPSRITEWVHFRAALLGVLVLAVPLYALLAGGIEAQQRQLMEEAASSFTSRQDPRVVFAIEEVLYDAGANEELAIAISGNEDTQEVSVLMERLLRLSPLSSLITHDVSVVVFDTSNTRVEGYSQGIQDGPEAGIGIAERDEYLTLKLMYEESGSDSILVDILTGRHEEDRFQYGGIGPIYAADTSDVVVGWIIARAEPRALLRDEGTLFPKVLLPQGVNQLKSNLSLAQFQGEVLVRSLGSDFGQYRMREAVYDQLKLNEDYWLEEKSGDKKYLFYYKRSLDENPSVTSTPISAITAVRASQMNFFDHLYYLLRLIIAGICVGGPLYILGRLSGFNVNTQLRYKDRVLNAFLGVGVVAVIFVGIVGLRVITAENDNAIRSWIRAQLDRVEEYLTLNAEFGELPSEVLARADVNDIAEKVGLDINVYENTSLSSTSREQLVEDRLIDKRLPIYAYYQLYYEGARNAYEEEQVGNFHYTAGYRVLSDSEGQPRFVISVPTLPEQERIEEERARTVAYLFGALLLLVIAVMLTASLLANALSRPIGRLREGLEAVAKGRFERPLPVDTRDEIGTLVKTFNSMQEQLAESRRKLAQQERQLAWREMARQVAHEIKNPLTPMKLSVQHLRRAYSNLDTKETALPESDNRFKNLFEKITTTLIEQVDALARIANEFSSFARMPKRLLEPLDLNAVLKEAVDLMQEQITPRIEVDFHEEPLVLQADREELRRIYINLIKNAIEASSHKDVFR
ncbi:MAG: HAMP domain-containing protein, partial [Rhodothermaceae bacterium]|nr:HAMP domain-containing protein [Rhodothermaceae bacterium]